MTTAAMTTVAIITAIDSCQSLSDRWKQLPAPLNQPADHRGVEDVRELLSQPRPGPPHTTRFFSILSQRQMRPPIEHQPGRQPLNKEVWIECSHQTSSAGDCSKVWQKTHRQIVCHHSINALKTQGFHQRLHPSKPNACINKCAGSFVAKKRSETGAPERQQTRATQPGKTQLAI